MATAAPRPMPMAMVGATRSSRARAPAKASPSRPPTLSKTAPTNVVASSSAPQAASPFGAFSALLPKVPLAPTSNGAKKRRKKKDINGTPSKSAAISGVASGAHGQGHASVNGSSFFHVDVVVGASSLGGGGGANCSAEVVCSSTKALRQKGSSFLRTHASKHGITNASRKLTGQVLSELTEHYAQAHRVPMTQEEGNSSVNKIQEAINSIKKPLPPPPPSQITPSQMQQTQLAVVTSAGAGMVLQKTVVQILPQHPVPQTQLYISHADSSHAAPIPAAIAQIKTPLVKMEQQQPNFATVFLPTKPLPVQPAMASPTQVTAAAQPANVPCASTVIAKTRAELAACGTSMLRPEAAAHKVHNASRKPKDQVIQELWLHYQACHPKDLAGASAAGHARCFPQGRTTIAEVAAAAVAAEEAERAAEAAVAAAEAAAAAGGWVGAVVSDDEEELKN